MKKVLKGIVNVLAWVVLIFAFLVTILVFTSESNNGQANLLGLMPMSVQSDSMSPTFNQGDMIIVKQVDLYDLNVDDVITFYTIIDGNRIKNSHRIVEINEEDGSRTFVTRGDNNSINDEIPAYASDIIGRWTGFRLPGGGRLLDFLRSKTGFFVCIVIPMALFFIFELYKFIAVLIETKKENAPQIDEEEIKKKAIEEYLAKERAEKEAKEKSAEASVESEATATEEK